MYDCQFLVISSIWGSDEVTNNKKRTKAISLGPILASFPEGTAPSIDCIGGCHRYDQIQENDPSVQMVVSDHGPPKGLAPHCQNNSTAYLHCQVKTSK